MLFPFNLSPQFYPILSFSILSYSSLSNPTLSPILSYPILLSPILSYPILLSPISPCCLSFWFDLFLLPYFTFPHLFHFLFLFFSSVLMTSLINQVLMIVVTYSWVAPLLMPMGSLFFCHSYLMYKYQLLYVYINKDQSGGFMW